MGGHLHCIKNITASFVRYIWGEVLGDRDHPTHWVFRCPMTRHYRWMGDGKEKFAKSAAVCKRKFALDYKAGQDCVDLFMQNDWLK